MNKLEQKMGEYFEIINPKEYDDFEIKSELIEPMGLVIITIYVSEYEHSWPYYSQAGKRVTLLELIKEEMENMFPYIFKVFCKVRHK